MKWDMVERNVFGQLTGMSVWCGSRPKKSQPYIFLVPVDGSSASTSAAHVAAQMADRIPNAELHLLNVQIFSGDDEQDSTLERGGLNTTEPARNALNRMQESYLLCVVAGAPAEAICSYAREHQVSEIVIGSHGASRIDRFLVGSVAMDIAEKSGVPVTFVKADDHVGRRPTAWIDWLVPCDGSSSSLRAVRYLANHLPFQKEKPLIHLLNVHKPDRAVPEQPLVTDAQQKRECDHGLTNHYLQQAKLLCEEAISILEEAHAAYEILARVGEPVPKILESANQLGCSHIVMGTRGLDFLGKLVVGSVSNGVVHGARVPVTLIA